MRTTRHRDQRSALVPCFTLLAAGLAASLSSTAHAAEGAITSVVVYHDRAQVTRSRSARCGAREATFAGLPSTLEPRTLAAALSGGPGEVVGITYEEEATGPRERAKVLQGEIRALDVKIVAQDKAVSATQQSEAKLGSFEAHMRRVWALQSTQARPPVKSWDQALDLLREQALRARRDRRAARAELRKLRRERTRLAAELSQIKHSRRRTTLKATALYKCSGAGQRTVRLSYVVPDATWRIGYQLRTKPQSAAVTVVAEAVVQQSTGEDWRDVRLEVSTANLQRENIAPRIRPMYVGARKPRSTRKVLARRFERREHLRAAPGSGGASTGVSTRAGKQEPGPAAAQPEGLAQQITAAERATILADGRQVSVTLARRSARGKLTLETVPKLFPFVYDKLELHNPFSFPMLPGDVSLFRGRAFFGKTSVKLRAPGEPFSISLGVAQQLTVKRYVKREKLKGPGVFGAKKQLEHRYAIEVGNWTTTTRRVNVLENIPVSQVREIKIWLADGATKPTDWNKVDGIATWKLTIPARSKRTIVVAYTIAVPKEYVVTGY